MWARVDHFPVSKTVEFTTYRTWNLTFRLTEIGTLNFWHWLLKFEQFQESNSAGFAGSHNLGWFFYSTAEGKSL